ncbi:MAG: metallophosphoesterase [Lentisphaerales bacterium]|jgi:predicted phosphodiesterase|nr:MAG: metallophosphoesterase [Lentisphaerales bacterium]
MRYAIISDIHSNLQAWNAVLLDLRSLNVSKIICLGDIVGYGPNPGEVLESVYANVDYLVLGNHDAALCGKLDESLFNESAARLLDWTRTRLDAAAQKFLNKIPLSLKGGAFRCVHGDYASPGYFNYVTDAQQALASWMAVHEPLLFAGHTHVPALFVLGPSGVPRTVDPQDFEMEDSKRYFVNVGSVGHPRDGDTRASYCIFDEETSGLFWRRIPFDIDAYRQALLAAGIPEQTSYFLCHDPRNAVPPVRQITSFSPPRTPDKAARNVADVQDLRVLQQRVRRWKALCIAVACAAAVAGVAIAWQAIRHSKRAIFLHSPQTPARIEATDVTADEQLLGMPAAPSEKGWPVAGWVLSLGNRYRQSIEAQRSEDGVMFLVLRSDTMRDELRVISPHIDAEPGMKLCMQGMFKMPDDFKGDIALTIELSREAEGALKVDDQFIRKPPNVRREGGWMLAKQTFVLPANSRSMRVQLVGKFRGQVEVKDLFLERKD